MILATMNDEDVKSNIVLCPHCLEEFHPWGHCQTFTPNSLATIVLMLPCFKELLTNNEPCQSGMFLLLSKIIYALGLSRLYKEKQFHVDLMLVAKKN